MRLFTILCLLGVGCRELHSGQLKLSPVRVEVEDISAVLYGENLSDASGVTLNSAVRTFSFAKEGNLEILSISLVSGDTATVGQTATITVTNSAGSAATTLTVYQKTGTVLTISTFTQVPVKSNGKNVGTVAGPYQCVELIKRYYATLDPARFGTRAPYSTETWSGSSRPYGLAVDYYNDDPTGKGLIRIPNDGSTLPQPGDVVVFGAVPGHKSGHVAIIDSEVTTDSKDVEIVEQNWTASPFGRAKLYFDGNHKLKKRNCTDDGKGSCWPILGFLRSGAPINFKPIGFLDGINSLNQVSGWAKDLDSPAAHVQVHIYIDKNAAPGVSPVAAVTASDTRADVGDHAFNWSIPAAYRDGQTHTVWVWAIDWTDNTGAHNVQLPSNGPTTFRILPSVTTGTVSIRASLDVTAWMGSLVFTQNGATPLSASSVPFSSSSALAGQYQPPVYISGGPPNSTFVGVTPSNPQTLIAGGAITFTFEFRSNTPLTGSMNEGRTEFTATVLNDGTVLAAGGGTGGVPIALSTAEIYNPSTNTWRTLVPMNQARVQATATKLRGGVQEGKVLIVGGTGTSPGPSDPSPSSAEIFDPATERFTPTPPMSQGHAAHAAVMLQDGRVLVISGDLTTGTCEIYDPVLNTWRQVSPLPVPTIHHSALLLPNGNVLVSGGSARYVGTAPFVYSYTPSTDTWRDMAPLLVPRSGHTMTVLPDNRRVLIVGGNYQNPILPEIYDPTAGANGQSQFGPLLVDDRTNGGHTATLLPNGDIVIAGGQGVGTFVKSIQVFQHLSLTWSPVQLMTTSRERHAAALLQNGQILFAGGVNETGLLKSAELWQP